MTLPLLERQYEYQEVVKAETIGDWGLLQPIINTAGWALTANGAEVATPAASIALALAGGAWRRVGMIAAVKFISPTIAGGEDISIMLNVYSNFVAAVRHHVLVSLRQGQLRIDKVVGDARTQLAATPFTLAQNTWANLEAERNGTAVRARVDGGAWLDTTVSESDVPLQGVFGLRCGRVVTSSFACKGFTMGMGAAA